MNVARVGGRAHAQPLSNSQARHKQKRQARQFTWGWKGLVM